MILLKQAHQQTRRGRSPAGRRMQPLNNVSEAYALRRGVLHGAAEDVAAGTDYSETAYVGGRSGAAELATLVVQEISTADMSFGTLLMILAMSTALAAGLYHSVRFIGWICQPRRPKVSRSPESSNEAEPAVRSPYDITVERTSLLSDDEEPSLPVGRL
jgi:hypothetical protein